jgi:hypothetical protein
MSNPLMDKLRRIPGEMGRLPSHGIGYEDGVFDDCVTNGDLEVFPVSSYDDILLKTPEMLLSGDAIYQVFERKIPWLKQPQKLFHKDVDFLLTLLRKVSFGDEMPVTYNHHCKFNEEGEEESKAHSYIVKLSTFINNTKRLDPTKYNDTFMLDNFKVKINNPLFKDILEITQMTLKMASGESYDNEKLEKATCDAISRSITSVDDVTDKETIVEWLTNIPSSYRKQIGEEMDNLSKSWGMDLTYKVKCKDCGEEIDLSPTLNPVSFFILP